MATWEAVLPSGQIQDQTADPIQTPEEGFIVGAKIWTLYNNDPIIFNINNHNGANPFTSFLYLCATHYSGSCYRLATDATLNLNPEAPRLRSQGSDFLLMHNQQEVFSKRIYRQPQESESWIDAPGGQEIILMSDTYGYGDIDNITYIADRDFKFFTGNRLRNQCYFLNKNGSDWNTSTPARDYHNVASNGASAGCHRWAYRSAGWPGAYYLRTEPGWSGTYSDWTPLLIENVYIGDYPPDPPEGYESSSHEEILNVSSLIQVENCPGLNLEITKMVLVDGFPTIALDSITTTQANVKIYNNKIIKNTIVHL